jgi:hypothetical protein
MRDFVRGLLYVFAVHHPSKILSALFRLDSIQCLTEQA